MILELILINLILCMVFNSGFVDSIDAAINKRYPLRHLPRPFSCCLCMTVWTSIIWLLCTGQLTLLSLTLSLVSATLTSVVQPLLKTVENYLLKAIEIMNNLID